MQFNQYQLTKGKSVLINSINVYHNYGSFVGNNHKNSRTNQYTTNLLNKPQFDTVSFTAKPKVTKAQLEQVSDMRVFNHHIYEFQKGIRSLILTTEKSKYMDYMKKRLESENIDYVMKEHKNKKLVNVYFGKKPCVDVVKTFGNDLSKLSPEQDFILGTMLGYDRVDQCKRYLDFKAKQKKNS